MVSFAPAVPPEEVRRFRDLELGRVSSYLSAAPAARRQYLGGGVHSEQNRRDLPAAAMLALHQKRPISMTASDQSLAEQEAHVLDEGYVPNMSPHPPGLRLHWSEGTVKGGIDATV
jgi:hypothetical protein